MIFTYTLHVDSESADDESKGKNQQKFQRIQRALNVK